MEEITFDARKYLTGFHPNFRTACKLYHENRDVRITKSAIKKFAKLRGNLGTKCILKIQTINKTKYTCSDFIAYTVDLSMTSWFEDLCMHLHTNDILTEYGKSIKGFDRDDIMKFDGYFYVYTRIKMQNTILPKKYRLDFEAHLKKWWNDVMTTLMKKFSSVLALHLKERVLNNTLNNGTVDNEFRKCIRNTIEPKEQYKEFGVSSFEKMIHHHEHKYVSTEQIIEWVYDRICIPLKFAVTVSIQEIKSTIALINQEHAKSNQPLEITIEELSDYMMARFVEPLMTPLFDLNYSLITEMAKLKYDRQSNGKFNHFNHFKELYNSSVERVFQQQQQQTQSQQHLNNIINYIDPTSKALNDFQVPFYHTISCNPDIHTKYLETMMSSQPHSVSTHFTPMNLDEFSKNCIAISFTHPTKSDSGSSLHAKIEKPKMDLFKNKTDKQFYLQFPDGFNYKVISPFTSHILDNEDVWKRYDEYYDSNCNTSFLHLLE